MGRTSPVALHNRKFLIVRIPYYFQRLLFASPVSKRYKLWGRLYSNQRAAHAMQPIGIVSPPSSAIRYITCKKLRWLIVPLQINIKNQKKNNCGWIQHTKQNSRYALCLYAPKCVAHYSLRNVSTRAPVRTKCVMSIHSFIADAHVNGNGTKSMDRQTGGTGWLSKKLHAMPPTLAITACIPRPTTVSKPKVI